MDIESWEEPATNEIVYEVRVDQYALRLLNFSSLEREMLRQPIEQPADILLNLELIFRRHGRNK